MHAGVDTQDFVELSGSEHTIPTQQDMIMVDHGHAELMMRQ